MSEMTIPRRFKEQVRDQKQRRQRGQRVNVSDAERWLSVVGGGVLVFDGLMRGNLGGICEGLFGAALVQRGWTGHCSAYQALNIDTSTRPHGERASVAAGSGIKFEHRLVIHRPVRALFDFWRNFENLPHIMRHLESVSGSGGRSHWVACGPLGTSVEWDAEIVNEKVDEVIAWRSLPGADVDTAGSVHFRPAITDQSTEVEVILKYAPPAGKLGAAIARLFGEAPEQQIREDLLRFKQFMESKETVATME